MGTDIYTFSSRVSVMHIISVQFDSVVVSWHKKVERLMILPETQVLVYVKAFDHKSFMVQLWS